MFVRKFKPKRFQGAMLKLERANKHIEQFNNDLAAFNAGYPYRLVLEKDSELSIRGPSKKRRVWVVRVFNPLDPMLTCVVGDAIHNLRAALDFMIFELVAPGKKDTPLVQFPFCKGPKSLEQTIRHRRINRAGKKVVEFIRKLQPYPGGNGDLLALLHDLDIKDKHQSIIHVGSAAIAPDLRVEDDAFSFTVRGAQFPAADGYKINRPSSRHNHLELGSQINMTADVIFDIGTAKTKSVGEYLARFTGKVYETIRDLSIASGK